MSLLDIFKKEKKLVWIKLDRTKSTKLLKEKITTHGGREPTNEEINALLDECEKKLNFYRYISEFSDLNKILTKNLKLAELYKYELLKLAKEVITKDDFLKIITEDIDNYMKIRNRDYVQQINKKSAIKELKPRSILNDIYTILGNVIYSTFNCAWKLKAQRNILKKGGYTEDMLWKEEHEDYISFLKKFNGKFKNFISELKLIRKNVEQNKEYVFKQKFGDPEMLLQKYVYFYFDAMKHNSIAMKDMDEIFKKLAKKDKNFGRFFDYKLFILRTFAATGLMDPRIIFARDEDITFKNGEIFVKSVKNNKISKRG